MSHDLVFTDTREFKSLLKSDSVTSNIGVRKQYVPDVIEKSDDPDDRTVRFVISTGAVDRDKDTINPNGFELDNFHKNPVVLFAHDARKPPIGRASEVKVQGRPKKLKASVEFMDNDVDTSGFSDMIYRMVKNGFLSATSVGFMPLDYDFTDDEERFMGIDFRKVELMEFSVVPVPSNPEALIDARKSGINTAPLEEWYEEALDSWAEYKEMLLVPKKQIEGLYKTLHGTGYKRNRKFKLTDEQQMELLRKNIERAKAQAQKDEPDETETITEEYRAVTCQEDFDVEFEINRKDTRATFPEQGDASGHIHTYDDTNHGVTSVNAGHSHTYKFGAQVTDPGGSDLHVHMMNGFMGQEPHERELDDGDKVVKLALQVDTTKELEDAVDIIHKRLETVLDAIDGEKLYDSGIASVEVEFEEGNVSKIRVFTLDDSEELDADEEAPGNGEEALDESASDPDKDKSAEEDEEDIKSEDGVVFYLDASEDDEGDEEEVVADDEPEEDSEPELTLEMVSQLVAEAVPAAVKSVIQEEIKRLTGRVD